MEQKRAGGRPGRMKKKEKKRNGIPARTRRGILAACMVFFFSLQIFQGKMLWRESTGESPGKVLSGKVPAEENERTQIMETTQQKEPVSDAQTAQEKETREQEREQLLTRLYARSAALVDADSGRVLLGKEEHVMRPMASTTKIMTCILALEKGNPKDLVTASANAVAQPKVHLGMHEGEAFYLGDLLYSLMLESHNDAAVMIAETIGGSIEGFAALMNEKAAAIGCTDTHFVTPNGLDASDAGGDHHTTAADLARIMRYCIKTSPKATEFLAVTQTRSYTFWDLEKKNMFNCCNHNALLDQMEGAISGKTGFTAKAGYCYTGALERDGKCLIVTLLACGWPNHKNYKWADAAKLLNYGLESYTYRDVLDHSWKPGRIEVTDGVYDGLLQTKSSASLTLVSPALDPARSLPVLLKETEIPKKDIFLPELIEAPVKKGEKVGSMTYSIDGILLAEYPVYAAETIEKIDYGWCMEQVAERLFCHASV